MDEVISRDGTAIAFDRVGEGPPVILAGGANCDRAMTRPLADELAQHFTVFNYDRRGRGDSGDTQPYAVGREVEDIEALITEAGGEAAIYGHSSGAGLALHAAAFGLDIRGRRADRRNRAGRTPQSPRRTGARRVTGRTRAGTRRLHCEEPGDYSMSTPSGSRPAEPDEKPETHLRETK